MLCCVAVFWVIWLICHRARGHVQSWIIRRLSSLSLLSQSLLLSVDRPPSHRLDYKNFIIFCTFWTYASCIRTWNITSNLTRIFKMVVIFHFFLFCRNIEKGRSWWPIFFHLWTFFSWHRCDMWKLHHDVLPLDVSIVMENYTTISSWACSWGCSQSCSCLPTSIVMEQYIVICSWGCSHACSCLHKYKAWLQAWLQITFI